MLVGNKEDLDASSLRAVPKSEGPKLKEKLKLDFQVETNALDKEHITVLFENVKDQIVKRINAETQATIPASKN